MSNLDKLEANRLGRKAFRGGLNRSPILDVYFLKWATRPGMDLVGVCAEWARGWDQENLKRDPEPVQPVKPASATEFRAETKCGAFCVAWSAESAETSRAGHEKSCPRCRCAVLEDLLRREQKLRDPARNDGYNREPGSRHHDGWKLARDIDQAIGRR